MNDRTEPEYTSAREDVLAKLDPELQRVVLTLRRGLPLPPHLLEEVEVDGATRKVVDVVARLHDPDKKVPGLWVVRKMGQVVTGMVEADKIPEVRDDDNVISLKAARRLRQMLADSVPEINASPERLRKALPAGHAAVEGAGVIVGFVDHGCDFSHPNFRRRDAAGSTRVLYLWDQRGGKTCLSPAGYDYGREFTGAMIDAALAEAPPTPAEPDRPHRRLGYAIKGRAHGTEVMDPAVGNGGGNFAPGVAPAADIIFVDASLGDFDDTDGSVGNSRHLLEAVEYIFCKAEERGVPAVVNISLNYDGGPHDGSTPVEEGFDNLLETAGRAIVIAAGNSSATGIHVRRTVRPGNPRTLLWGIDEKDATTNKLEIWYEGRHRLEVTLRSPGGQTLGPYAPGTTHAVSAGGEVAALIFNRLHDPGNGDNQVLLLFGPPIAPGVWKIDLRAACACAAPFEVHAWIEKDEDGKPSTFQGVGDPSDSSCTIGTICCGNSTIVVGGYHKLDGNEVMRGTAEGPTRDGKLKPEVSAPGVGSYKVPMLVAQALTASVGETVGGTSLAAPHVAGAIALLMEVALKDRGRLLTTDETRAFVRESARNLPPPDLNSWDTCYGAGRVDAAGCLINLLQAGQGFVVAEQHEEFFALTEVRDDSGGGGGEGDAVKTTVVASKSMSVAAFATKALEGPAPSVGGGEKPPPDLPPTKGH